MARTKVIGAAVLFALAGAAYGCSGEVQIGSKVESPPPPPPAPADGDGDGIPDADDKCPTEAEDGKQPDPNDGCPNKDEDGDGIEIPADKCPTEPETKNGFEDEDGCPDKKPLVQVVGTRVQINQKILFEKGKSTITDDSMKVVEAVADVLKKNAGIQLVEVGGHASKEGPAALNRTLTQKRVDSVSRELAKMGVAKERLMSQGYGFYCLLAQGDAEADHEKNRRVEFRILRQDGKDTDEVGKRGCEGAVKAGIKPKALPKPKAPAAAKKAPSTAAKAPGKLNVKKK